MVAVLYLGLLALLLPLATSHPQCLNFQPPFSAEGFDLTHCAEYDELGCCEKERPIARRFEFMIARLPEGQREDCAPYLRNISCLECSPYAAHIFEVENGGEERSFPLLCPGYCEEAYLKCSSVGSKPVALMRYFKLHAREYGVANRPRTAEKQMADAKQFCSAVAADDTYCYPNILNGPQIDGIDAQPEGELGCICALPVATGLRNPVVATHAGDKSGRMFIAEQIGVIRVLLANNTLLAEPFLDISSSVLTSSRIGDERGFLGLAFHPDYARNGKFYVYYSASERRSGRSVHISRVSEFVVQEGNGNVANATSERVVLSLVQPFSNHNGGELFFDHDGYLLISLGDGGGAGDRQNNALDRSNWLGSILRIDVDRKDSGKEYAIPADNPFVGVPNVKPEIYAYGLRNAWRCSIDRGDRETGEGRGRIFCGDVGQGKFEEVDLIVKGGNYGWRAFEGNSCFDRALCDTPVVENAIPPIHAYGRDLGVSVTGGFVYRGCLFPNLRGIYVFADYGSGKLFALREDKSTGNWTRSDLCMGDSDVCTGDLVGVDRARFVLSFGEDEDGELYVLTSSSVSTTAEQGVVYQIVDPARREFPRKCRNNIKDFSIGG